MKQILIFSIVLAFIKPEVIAQNQPKQNAINLNTGFSLVRPASSLFFNLSKTIVNAVDTSYNKYVKSISVNSYPAIQVYYDRNIHGWKKISFSIGGSISYQYIGLKLYHYSYRDTVTGIRFSEDALLKLNRWNFAFRALIHYGISENADFYSGIRLGLTHWGMELTTSDKLISKLLFIKFSANQFAPQIVLLGIKKYFTQKLGANIEFCLGSPSYLSLGLSYKFI